MTLDTNLQNLTIRMATEMKAIRTLLNGNAATLAALTTTDKTSLVAAINELDAAIEALSGGSTPTTLDELTDVQITAVAADDILKWDGAKWINTDGTTLFDPAGAAAAAQAAAIAASQPLDGDLSNIAALATQAYGRGLLTLANTAGLMGLLSDSSETVKGIVELATVAEAQAGIDTVRAVTPAGVAAVITQLIGAAPTDLNEWAELVAAIQASEDDISGLMTAITGKQDADATLTALAGVATAANKLIYATGVDTFATCDITAFGRTLLGVADAPAARTALDVWSKGEVGPIDTDYVALFEANLT